MEQKFVQKRIDFLQETSTGMLKISDLISLLDEHPYKDIIVKSFNTDSIIADVICIENIDVVFNRVRFLNEQFKRFNVLAHSKDITITQHPTLIDDISELRPLVFNFGEYVEEGEIKQDLSCFAIYNSKNSFFDEYDMAKYANRLYKENLSELADLNLQYFKALAESDDRFNKHRSYRLVRHDDNIFLRGITSVNRYNEYGVDFTFVVTMLMLHLDMKSNEGNGYEISSAALSESKLELIVSEEKCRDAAEFGKVSTAIVITTNDLGEGSLNYTKIIKVGVESYKGVFLFPKPENSHENKDIIAHSTGSEKAMLKIKDVMLHLNNTEDFIKELIMVKGIKTPDELRARIFSKLSNKQSAFKEIKTLADIFKTPIENEISSFSKLLEMCNKAEELEIDYDLKDKLRYIISDIILSRGREK